MMITQAYVREFHREFDVAAPDTLDTSAYPALLRVELIREELRELMEATGIAESYGLLGMTHKLEEQGPIDVAKTIDALCDLLYVVLGSAVSLGVDLLPFFRLVHDSNMAKLGPDGKPIRRSDGKVLKPEGWTPPDIEGYLDAFYPDWRSLS